MDVLDDDRKRDGPFGTFVAAETGGDYRQRGANALPPAACKVAAYLRDQRHVRAEVSGYGFFDLQQIVFICGDIFFITSDGAGVFIGMRFVGQGAFSPRFSIRLTGYHRRARFFAVFFAQAASDG